MKGVKDARRSEFSHSTGVMREEVLFFFFFFFSPWDIKFLLCRKNTIGAGGVQQTTTQKDKKFN